MSDLGETKVGNAYDQDISDDEQVPRVKPIVPRMPLKQRMVSAPRTGVNGFFRLQKGSKRAMAGRPEVTGSTAQIDGENLPQ